MDSAHRPTEVATAEDAREMTQDDARARALFVVSFGSSDAAEWGGRRSFPKSNPHPPGPARSKNTLEVIASMHSNAFRVD